MTVIRLDTEEALFKDLSQRPWLEGLALLTLGLPIGFFNQNERKVEDILHIMFSVLTTSSQINLKANKKKNITLSYAVVQMHFPNFMCRKVNAKDGSVRHGTFMSESRAPEGSNGCRYHRRWLLTHRSSGLLHTLMRHSPLILDF